MDVSIYPARVSNIYCQRMNFASCHTGRKVFWQLGGRTGAEETQDSFCLKRKALHGMMMETIYVIIWKITGGIPYSLQ